MQQSRLATTGLNPTYTYIHVHVYIRIHGCRVDRDLEGFELVEKQPLSCRWSGPHKYVNTRIYTYINVYVRVDIPSYTYKYAYIIYVYIRAYIRTYTYIYGSG